MGLFSKKLTSAQEAELQEFARTLQMVRQQSEQAFSNMLDGTKDLMAICHQALREDRDLEPSEFLLDSTVTGSWIGKTVHHTRRMPEQTVDMTSLIQSSKQTLETYSNFLRDTLAKVLSLRPADWYPKKIKTVYDSWVLYFKLRVQFLDVAFYALQPPEPLNHDPRHGNDKLNAFVWALKSMAVFSKVGLLKGLSPEIDHRKQV